ncbi:transportin-3-like isoform X2 [Branchiostoma floridae]|uniref:Transportin-3 n=1 Tax=Branchiostoma floridae TaxID=7739 RepID=A0A9J7KAG1_BRAFL|nr:transportin-3-like isoform X1 [Branchiostoma floridae]XP_035663111.1 transportin-3-like isoform X2 [Branchiostoma floridae]
MDSAPSTETVVQAIQTLYHNPDPACKERASAWLGELQRSVFAWEVADQLLRNGQDLETSYFAAQTMRTKIQYAFHELPQSAHQSLKESLLNHAQNLVSNASPVIITQLALALADLALQVAGWKCPAKELIEKFGNTVGNLPFLLEVLTVLPEEVSFILMHVNSRSLRLGANRRGEVIEELAESCDLVIQLLIACTQSCAADSRVQAKVYRCLGSWFNLGVIQGEAVATSQLLNAPFQAMHNPETVSSVHEAACDCICSALYVAEDITRYESLANCLFQGVISLSEPYHVSVAQEDIDKSLNYCRVFTELAESFLELMMAAPGQGLGDLRILDLLLACVGHCQYEVAEITFNFWYRLSEVLYKRDSTNLNTIFKPYFQRLINSLSVHCQMDEDHEGVPDETDDFADFRIRVSELIKDVVFIVGSINVFTQLFRNLAETPNTTWDVTEAHMYVMSAVAKNLMPFCVPSPSDESEVVPQVLQAVLNLPQDAHIAVRYTGTQLVGELCEWIDRHPDTLDSVLNFLLAGLQHPKLGSVSATSLQNICAACREQMARHFKGLLQIVEALDNLHISNEAAVGLLKGISLILTKMPHDQLAVGLRALCQIQADRLSQLIVQNESVKEGTRTDPTIFLDRLASIFSLFQYRHTAPEVQNGQIHPCQQVVQEVWPVLSDTCNKYQADIRIVERCCRCIRFAVRCVGKQSAGLLQPLVTQMVNVYQTHQHSCFLYLGSILVDEYGMEEGCRTGLLDMLKAFCGPTFQLLKTGGLRNHPDTIDDLFRLCARFVQRCPLVILHSEMIDAILECAMAASTLDHRDANASVMKFLRDLVHTAIANDCDDDYQVRRDMVEKLMVVRGPQLVQSLMSATVFYLPSYMLPDVADVVFELMRYNRASFCVWLEHALKGLPTETTGGAINATHKQLTDFHKQITSAEEVKTVSSALRDFSRLYR